jgi:hypothetical protein
VTYDEGGFSATPCVRCSCAWRIFARRAATLCAHSQSSGWLCVSLHLHAYVRRIRTATAFYRSLNDWTSWLQPWESSVKEGL